LQADYGTPEFDIEYQAAITGTPRRKPDGPSLGTLNWLIDRYRESAAWAALSRSTQRQRENILAQVLKTAGEKPYAAITAAEINAGLARRAKTPFQARHFLDTMRGLFKWATKNNHIKIDPTANVERPQRKTGDGFPPWTEEMARAYQRHWPLGTRQRVWLDVLLYTGLRVGDAFCFGKQHSRAGEMKTEKTGQIVYPEISPELAETLAAGPIGDLTYIISGNGSPFTNKGAFGNAFTTAAKAAGVRGSAHGVRKLAATRDANAGASEAMLEARYGWSGGRMASHYTRTANRRKLANSIPAPREGGAGAGRIKPMKSR